MSLTTVQTYIDAARDLLQDEHSPYRYANADLVRGLNLAIAEAVRLRPDLFFKTLRSGTPTVYSAGSLGTSVSIDVRYQVPLLYYMVGHVQLADQEDGQDARASALLNKFVAQLQSLQA